jgi:indolepyruvate ferredoxin oxidoreductase beta subunit
MRAERPGIDRPYTLLIAALGGEGGGLLTDWIVEACTHADLLVQSTSIPGVAQRTGATTYYVEMMRAPPDAPAEPLFALYPAPGYVDMAVASELIEAGRLVENGFVTPDRTTLVASTHRIFSMAEKTAMGDGAFAAPKLIDAARAFAATPVLRDFAAAALACGGAVNSLLLGAMAAQVSFPLEAADLEAAIRARGVAVEANLRAFRAGVALAGAEEDIAPVPDAKGAVAATGTDLQNFPETVRDILEAGVERLVDYQDRAYADLYLERLAPLRDALGKDGEGQATLREAARYLALWMAYEDVIRVADLKSRASRHARVRRETGAQPGEPVKVREFFKPGIDEVATILPGLLSRPLVAWAERTGRRTSLNIPLHVRSDTVTGHLILRFVASLKGKRRRTHRFADEQALIERWLAAVHAAAHVSPGLAHETALCGRLVKGYGDTRARARQNFETIMDRFVQPALEGGDGDAAPKVHEARDAALADEEGSALAALVARHRLGELPTIPTGTAQAAE